MQPAEEVVRHATAAYYGMIDTVDGYLGQVIDQLSQTEDLDDWIIIYSSDHGEMLGEHGVWEKGRFYEGSVRVPLVIRWPRMFDGGRTIDENVNLCDLFATLCDLAGIETPDGLDSRSLAPLLRGESTTWNNETVSQYEYSHLMIKQDHLKYQYYGEGVPEVLFDLHKDPGEQANIAGDGGYAAAMTSFRHRLSELGHGPHADNEYRNAGYTAAS